MKTSSDLEIYTIDNPTKEKLEEICDLRQPVVLNMNIDNIVNNCTLALLDDNYGAFDVKIRNTLDHNNNNELYLPLVLNEAIRVFQSDTHGKFITENNVDFLDETGIIKHYKYNDEFFRPHMVSKCIYDFWSGSKNSISGLDMAIHIARQSHGTITSLSVKSVPGVYALHPFNPGQPPSWRTK